MKRLHSAAPDAHQFARLDFADIFGADEIECAGLRRHHPGVAKLAQAQRTKPARIANGIHLVAGQYQQRIRALHLIERIAQRARQIARGAAGHQVHDHFGVAGGLEDRALVFERAAKLGRRW